MAHDPAPNPSASATASDPAARLQEIRARVAELHATALAAVASLQRSAVSDQQGKQATPELKADGRKLTAGSRSEPMWPRDLSAEPAGPGEWGPDPAEVAGG